ncbi:gamma-glutamyltransferase [Pyrofollis japonicus]|nr:gamma-glutamyltransferase [Pyrofollis japonicus]
MAALAGVRVLEEGGNAADAAVAVGFVLSVALPHLGGLGGDFFALIRLGSGETLFIDGSGPAPRGLSRDLLASRGYDSMPLRGPLAVNVPGMVDGLRLLWERLGSLEWSRLIEPAARIAENGFGAPPSLGRSLEALCSEAEDPGLRETFCKQYRGWGSWLRFPGLARALKEVARDPRSFYEGDIAEKISNYIEERGGVLSPEDLASYRAEEGRPLETSYRGARLYEMPPPTQGITTLHIMKLLEAIELSRVDPLGPERIRAHLEAYVPAYWARDTYVTDPRYMRIPVEELLSSKFIEDLRRRRGLSVEEPRKPSGDTTFYVVADSEGNIVAGIQSLFHPFGSLVVEPTYQIPLNNRASSFSLDPSHANTLEPGKKTMHTLSALIIDRGEETYALGLSGGHPRPQLHSLLATNLLDYEMNPQQALDAPRFAWPPGTKKLRVEKGYRTTTLSGYTVEETPYPSRLGVASILLEKNGKHAACSDARGDGTALAKI